MTHGVVRQIVLIIALLVAGCSSEEADEPSPGATITPTVAARMTPTTKVLATTPPERTACTPQQHELEVRTSLRGYGISGGIGDPDDACRLFLVGLSFAGRSSTAVVLGSHDGGRSLEVLTEIAEGAVARQIQAVDGALWVVGRTVDGRGFALTSTDSGRTWRRIYSPVVDSFSDIRAVAGSADHVWIAGRAGSDAVVAASSDGGATWHEAYRLAPAGQQSASFVSIAQNGRTVVAAGSDGSDGVAAISTDGGDSFRAVPLPAHTFPLAAAVSAAEDVFVGGYRLLDPAITESRTAALIKWKHDSASWDAVSIQSELYLAGLQFISADEGYALTVVKNTGALVMTHDGGETWELEGAPQSVLLRQVGGLFPASGTLYLYGRDGLYALGR